LKYEFGSYIVLLTPDKKKCEGNTIILGRGKGKREKECGRVTHKNAFAVYI